MQLSPKIIVVNTLVRIIDNYDENIKNLKIKIINNKNTRKERKKL